MSDNVDLNQVTLTGKRTFHGMAVISASTSQIIKDVPSVQRLTERRKASDFVKKEKFQLFSTLEKAVIDYRICQCSL